MELDVMITNACNASCPICFVEATKEKGIYQNKNSLESFLRRAQEIDNLIEVHFTGGEPTLNADFYDIISITDKLNIPFQFVTNGYDLNLEFDFYQLKNLKKVVFSIYGPSEFHNRFVGLNGAFDKIIDCIKYFEDHSCNIQINITCFDENIELLSVLLDSLNKYKIDIVKLYPLVKKGRASKAGYLFDMDKYMFYTQKLNKYSFDTYIHNFKEDKLYLNNNCLNSGTLFINEIGEIYPCLHLAYAGEKLGTLSDDFNLIVQKRTFFDCKRNYYKYYKECSKGVKKKDE